MVWLIVSCSEFNGVGRRMRGLALGCGVCLGGVPKVTQDTGLRWGFLTF